ncbi:non-heme iron oxygenase ferredoxin subunit [Fodinisporobacter ferrooxydans]|uniref:Non-heme iron oxygenase ferredoxin subunit n=1 Tax=Fodinisporobacter ferrooxydans TaxID=2901836 RepID=A0ABY4CQU6_9BACL|nr:non-heme iron oxygenase ferredoxin subunit [Alicyclobacillaceae bacterium MYW30-H2]
MARVNIGKTSDLQPGEMKRIVIGYEDLALYNIDGKYFVTSDVCTHANESLTEGKLAGNIIACPKHGGKFDVCSGKAVAFPCVTPIDTYEVEVEGDSLFIEIDA